MLRGTRPTVPLLASFVVLTGALAACGSDTPGTGLQFADRLDAVTISGDVGDATIEFKERMQAGELESETTIEGEGAALKDKDTVFVNYVIGDGYTQKSAIDSFGEDAPALELTVGAAPNPEPQTLDDVLTSVLAKQVKAGVTQGSRLVLTGSTEAIFGAAASSPGLATAGIGNDDGLVMVVDVEDVTVLDGPDGEPGKFPGWAPKIDFDGNGPTGFDFEGVAKPDPKAKQLFTVLKQGTGTKVAKGDLLVLDYVGSVYDATTPFLNTFTADMEPQRLAAGAFSAEGFNQILDGQAVGSRIIMRIPPASGFGDEAQGELVPAGSTLYFLVDILAAV